MGSEFLVYLRLGFEHIADPRGYDHILFIVALTATYLPRAWRQVVAMVTAFTVGHSVTLALATLGLIRIPTSLIEFLIPVTILVTALLNGVELRHGEPSHSAATALATSLLRVPQRAWIVALSSTAGAVALYLVWDRLPLG